MEINDETTGPYLLYCSFFFSLNLSTLHTEASGSADNRPLEERIGDKVRKCDPLHRSLIDDRIGRLERQLTLI
jgi:hypothetical protein